MKGKSFLSASFTSVLVSSCLFFILPAHASLAINAHPTGGQVTDGRANIQQNGSETFINQQTDKAVINWNAFNVDKNHSVRFKQPDSDSWTFNRVSGFNPSTIDAQVKANGNIAILNSAGIVFGNNARVDVNGLLATTLNFNEKDLDRGLIHFKQVGNRTSAIVNNGHITVKDEGVVALVAPGVENNGIITANMGAIALLSADEYTIDLNSDGLVNFKIGNVKTRPHRPDGTFMTSGVNNTGSLIAHQGAVLVSSHMASNIVENVINMDGIVETSSVAPDGDGVVFMDGSKNGHIRVGGKINAGSGGVFYTSKSYTEAAGAHVRAGMKMWIDGESPLFYH